MNRDYEIRKKKGYIWKMETKTSILSGYTVDNLDTKNLDQAESEFEIAFIKVRQALEGHDTKCLDNELERLQVCQTIAKEIVKDFKHRTRRI